MPGEARGRRRRQTPEELAAIQRRSEARVLGEVRKGMGAIQPLRARYLRLARLEREQERARVLLPHWVAIPAVAALVFVCGGVYFEWAMGGGFLFFGHAALRVEARMLSIDVLRIHARCGQHARLEFQGAVARICVEERLAAKAPKAGDAVAVYGRGSRLGLYVREIHAK